MKYPNEAPVFKIARGPSDKIKRGAVVEGLIGTWYQGKWYRGESTHLCVRAINKRDITAPVWLADKTEELYGIFGCQVMLDDLDPMTPAAEEMLAIARGAQ